MSFQDTLMNLVTIDNQDCADVWEVSCWKCGRIGLADNIDDANNTKITHENDHGIYLDPDTGEMWYDPEDSYI